MKYSVIDKKGNKVSEFEVVEEKEWPENGSDYWFVDGYGRVHIEGWLDDPLDYDRKKFGNVFRTKEEALQARDLIKELLRILK